MNSLTDQEIKEICLKNDIPLIAICSKDDIRDIQKGFYIINLQSKDSNGPGTHWTALFYDDCGVSLYYDSFGFPAPDETEEMIKPYLYNSKQVQNIKTSSCGYYCIAFIKIVARSHDKVKGFESFVNLFDDDTQKNEKILHRILYG